MKKILNYIFLFVAFLLVNQISLQFVNLNSSGVYPDYLPSVTALLNGDFIGTRYPPLHVLFSALKVQISNATGIHYRLISLSIYFPIMVLTWHQIYYLSNDFLTLVTWRKLSAWLFCLYPLYLLAMNLDLSLISYTLFLLLSLNALLSIPKKNSFKAICLTALLSGLFLGVAALIRPTPLLLPLVIMLPFYVRRITGSPTVMYTKKYIGIYHILLLASFSVTILPWSIYGSIQSGNTVILSKGFLPSHRDGLRRFPPLLTKQIVNSRVTNLPEAIDFHLHYFKNHTIFYTTVWVKKAIGCWNGSDSGRWDLWFGLINGLYLLFFLIGLLKTPLTPTFLILIITIAYHWFLSLLVLSIARYQVPIFPIICIFTAKGILNATTYIKKSQILKGGGSELKTP